MDASQPSKPPALHEDSLCEATTELTVSNSVLGLTSDLHGRAQDARAAMATVTGRAAGRALRPFPFLRATASGYGERATRLYM